MISDETLETCMNTPGEVHSVWIGMTTAFRQTRRTPVPPDIPEQNRLEIASEYPYYLAGFYIARGLQIIGVLVLMKVIL